MGECAMYGDEEIKIGTCEQMYYLRADQAHLVRALPGNVDPIRDRESIRFRFPFPDEDGLAPGAFDNCDRAVWMHDVPCPEDVEHNDCQFQHQGPAGTVLALLPCPNSKEGKAHNAHRNGYQGDVGIHSQRCLDGLRMLVCKCGACGAMWRVPTGDEAMPYIEACRKRGAELERRAGCLGYPESYRAQSMREASFWYQMGTRIAQGYKAGAGDLGRPSAANDTTP